MDWTDNRRMEESLHFMLESDVPAAKARAKVKALERKEKTIKAIGFLNAVGTVGERDARSVTTKEWIEHVEDYEDSVSDSETFENQRKTNELVIEVWRTIQANQRRGNV